MRESKRTIQLTLFRGETSIWESADKVTDRLETIYRSWGNARVQKLPFSKFRQQVLGSFKDIDSREDLHHIVVIDYHISLAELSFWLSYLPPEKTTIWFHLFGDGMIRKDEIKKCVSHLKGLSIRFFVASEFVKKELNFLPEDRTHVVPFPIDERYFQGTRTLQKGLSVAYVGRLCVDKGLLPLAKWWLSQEWKTKLALFGTWDKTGGKYSRMDKAVWLQETRKLRKTILENKRSFKRDSWKTPRKGSRFLSATNVVLSFSQFPLEEFGLGLVEAMASGCAVICSDWMGHQEFEGAPLTRLLPVTKNGVETKDLSSEILRLNSASKSQRQSQRVWARKRFSVEAVDRQLRLFYRKDLSRFK